VAPRRRHQQSAGRPHGSRVPTQRLRIATLPTLGPFTITRSPPQPVRPDDAAHCPRSHPHALIPNTGCSQRAHSSCARFPGGAFAAPQQHKLMLAPCGVHIYLPLLRAYAAYAASDRPPPFSTAARKTAPALWWTQTTGGLFVMQQGHAEEAVAWGCRGNAPEERWDLLIIRNELHPFTAESSESGGGRRLTDAGAHRKTGGGRQRRAN
jgi:hypothetical protein